MRVFKQRKPFVPRYNLTDRIKPWEPKLIKSKVARNILLILGTTAGVASFALNPVVGAYILIGVGAGLANSLTKAEFNKEVRRLEKKGYVALTKTPEGFLVKLLKKGKQRLKKAQFQEIQLPKEKIWDKKWRFFIFDVPEKNRIARDLLRQKLKDLGMYNIQRSVFAYPHDCREELAFISDYYGLTPYTTYAEVSYSDIDRELRRYFKIR